MLVQRNVVCHACNKPGHIARYCKSKNAHVDNNKSNEKGKAKVEEIRDQYKKMRVKKEDSNV